MDMSWQTVELLKAVLCTGVIGVLAVKYILQQLNTPKYKRSTHYLAVIFTLCGIFAYFNYGMFHWNKYPKSIHYYDMYHYFIGGKYFQELGYFDLYTATVVADQDNRKFFNKLNNFKNIRDLRTDKLVPWRQAVKNDGERIKAKFTPERWKEFVDDIESFQRQMPARHWRHALKDFGFNPPPPWALMGRFLAEIPNIQYQWQLIALGWVDVLLMAIAFIFVYRAFGLYPLMFTVILFGVNYTQRYQHMSGSLLRLDWLAYLLIGISMLKMKKPKWGGAFIGYATMLRVFPLMFLAGIGFKWLYTAIKERKIVNDDFKTLLSSLVIAVILFGMTLVVKPGLDGWKTWIENISHHSQRLTVKRIALQYLFIYAGETDKSSWNRIKKGKDTYAFRDARKEQFIIPIRILQGLGLAMFILVAVRSPSWVAAILGLFLCYVLTNPVRYYWAMLATLGPFLITTPLDGKKLLAFIALMVVFIVDYAIDSTTLFYNLHQFWATLGVGSILLYIMIIQGQEVGVWQDIRLRIKLRQFNPFIPPG